ncbi:hypothetical protein CK216_22950 [Mesorhizobium sp. WSM3876]|nr:hypothetical protein CK216_22950 [Mesorhizobium sp. WSM3876]
MMWRKVPVVVNLSDVFKHLSYRDEIMSELRRNRIFDILRVSGRVNLLDLANELQISSETVRRDLKRMADEGVVEIVRGGATLPDVLREAAFQHCLNLNADLKRKIAAAAATLVENGDTIMIGGGSTTCYLALALRDHRNLRIITNSVDAARILGSRGENEVHAVGGRLDDYLGSTVGVVAVENIRRYSAEKTFFSVGAVDASIGLTSDTADEVACWQAMIEAGSQAIALIDSSKFGQRCLFKCASFEEIDTIVADRSPDPALAASFAAHKIEFINADGSGTAEKSQSRIHRANSSKVREQA